MLRAMWSRRLPGAPGGGVLAWTWCIFSLLVVVLAPAQVWDGLPIWAVPLRGVAQLLLSAIAFLSLALFLGIGANRPNGVRLLHALFAALACYGTAYWILKAVRPELMWGRSEFLLAAAFGIVLAFLPYVLFPSHKALAVGALATALALVLFLGFRPTITGRPQPSVQTTALKLVSIAVYPNLVDPVTMARGGAIEAYGKSFLLVTGDGVFYVLDWDRDSLVERRLPLSLPRDPSTSPADLKHLMNTKMLDHKITDMVLDTTSVPTKVFVAYQRWDSANQCFTVRVSVAALEETGPPERSPADAWKPIFDTWPCQPLFPGFGYLEGGGRLAWLGDKLLLTVGDFGLAESGRPAPSQSVDSAYGKVLLLDRAGGHEIFTMGHRNAQGLLVDREHRIWLTEHGPQGGDELNLLKQGHNYGYPLVTYGTAYGRYFWPLAPAIHDHGEFTEPVYAFARSVGISSLIRVESDLFSEWKHDLLVASLNLSNLYRMRLRDERVIYVEPIFIGQRIRDLAEGADGRIVIWADFGRVVTLTPGPPEATGSAVFDRCRSCHEAPQAESGQMSLSLRGIVGANVARQAGYPYSPALVQLGGTWTEDRLDAFLADPDGFAPGSTMTTGRVPDPHERQALIGFLKKYR